MLLGVRQCGKTYIIEEFCKNEYNNYSKINLLKREDIADLFKRPIDAEEKLNILKDILQLYFKDMRKYVSSNAESLKIERVYKSLPSQLMNVSKKFQYSTFIFNIFN